MFINVMPHVDTIIEIFESEIPRKIEAIPKRSEASLRYLNGKVGPIFPQEKILTLRKK